MTASPSQPSLPEPFLDVPTLLDRSVPQAQVSRVWYFVGGFLLVIMGMAVLASVGMSEGMTQALIPLVLMLLVGGMLVASFLTVQKHRAQGRQIEAIEEFVLLRNWTAAAVAVEQLLLSPPRSTTVRVQALIFLTSVLSRYSRHADAIMVQDYLLENVAMDPSTDNGLRAGRAIAMLREDHLFDADRAIAELRRMGDREGAGVTLVEIYRDVKTGHPAEAVQMFERRLPTLREKLGHRVADAYALAARAYDLLNREDDARQAWRRATMLAPTVELTRRYPEITATANRFGPSAAPVGM